MSDDTREFTKDNPPAGNEGTWYRSSKVAYAAGPFDDVKVGGKKGSGFVVIENPDSNETSKLSLVPAEEFLAEFSPADPGDFPAREQHDYYDLSQKDDGTQVAAAAPLDVNGPDDKRPDAAAGEPTGEKTV